MGNENFAFLLLLSIYRFVIEGRLVEWRCLSSVFGPCFVWQYLHVVSFLVLESSCWERENWYFYCLADVM